MQLDSIGEILDFAIDREEKLVYRLHTDLAALNDGPGLPRSLPPSPRRRPSTSCASRSSTTTTCSRRCDDATSEAVDVLRWKNRRLD